MCIDLFEQNFYKVGVHGKNDGGFLPISGKHAWSLFHLLYSVIIMFSLLGDIYTGPGLLSHGPLLFA